MSTKDKQELEGWSRYVQKMTQQAKEVLQPHIDACVKVLAKVISKESN